MTRAGDAVAVLNTALAAEHAALYVHGVLGAQTSQSQQPALFTAVTDAYLAHRAQRDRLVRQVRDLGGTPVAAEPAYEVPDRLRTPAAVNRTALAVERATAETWAWVVAGTSGLLRRAAIEVLTRTAVRELVFRGTPETFPGADEHADR